MEEKYLVSGDTRFYPWIYEFDTLEEAEKQYELSDPFDETIYLSKVIKAKTDKVREL